MPENAQELEILKKQVPIWLAAETRLKKLEQRGQEWVACCPYHNDTNPSLQMYVAKDGAWMSHCKSCGTAANVFQLVEKCDKVNFNKAVEIVRNMVTGDWAAKRAKADAVFQKAIPQNAEKITVSLAAFQSYIDARRNSPLAAEWLRNRGITEETAEQLNIGFVQQPMSAIVYENHPWYASGWMVFPEVRDGKIVAAKYRSVVGKRGPNGESGFAQRKDMLKSPLYNAQAINFMEELFVVEGEPDCLVMAQAGFCTASLPSASCNPNAEIRDQLMQAPVRYLAGDTDEAGIKAMQKLHSELDGDNPKSKTYLLLWPKPYKDANETFLKACGGDIPKFRELVLKLMQEARDRRLPGIQDMRNVIRNANFKPTHDNPNRLVWPWANVDKWCDILPGEVMFLFSTDTKQGKSSWLMNLLVYNVMNGNKVVNYSAELSPERYAQAMVAHMRKKNRNNLTSADFQKAAEELPEDSFYIGYKPGAKFSEVMKLLADAKSVYGADIVVVDPLHFLIRGTDNENRDFAAAMRDLVDFSIKWNCIVIVVGQARKSVGGQHGKMAQGQDARFSKALTEDAATTWILHRDRLKQTDDSEDEPVYSPKTKIRLEHARFAEATQCNLLFDGPTASFLPWSAQMEPRNDEKASAVCNS